MRAYLSDQSIMVGYCPHCGADTPHFVAVYRRVKVGLARATEGEQWRVCFATCGGRVSPDQVVAALPSAFPECRDLRFDRAVIHRQESAAALHPEGLR